jgi:hypothetical protein
VNPPLRTPVHVFLRTIAAFCKSRSVTETEKSEVVTCPFNC